MQHLLQKTEKPEMRSKIWVWRVKLMRNLFRKKWNEKRGNTKVIRCSDQKAVCTERRFISEIACFRCREIFKYLPALFLRRARWSREESDLINCDNTTKGWEAQMHLDVLCIIAAKGQRAWGAGSTLSLRLNEKFWDWPLVYVTRFKSSSFLPSALVFALTIPHRRVNKISCSRYKFPTSFLSSTVHFVRWTSKQKLDLFTDLSSSINWDRLECQFNGEL